MVKDNGPVAVLNSGRSCHTPCAGVIILRVPELSYLRYSSCLCMLEYRGLGMAENWKAMYSDVIPVDDIMLRYQRYLTTTKSVFLC